VQRAASFLLALLAILGFGSRAAAQRYDVTLQLGASPHARVEAQIPAPDGRLFTHSHAGGYEWSDYISNLQASAPDGRALTISATGKGAWSLAGSGAGPIKLSYDVDLAFTVPPREGAQRGGQAFADSLYIVNRALFVMTNAAGPREVVFHVAPGVRIASPWTRLGSASFRAASNADLVDNTTVLGRFPEFDLRDGAFHLDFVLPGATAAEGQRMEPVIRKVLHEYLRIFPKTPEFHILMAYFQGVEVNGEGYKDSATLTFPEPIGADNREIWANYIAHELFHHWNAALIQGADSGADLGSTEWFSEGATEYVANRTLVRTGVIQRSDWLRRMNTNVSMYEFWTWAAPFTGLSLRDAGSRTTLPRPKGVEAKTYNRAGIYNGGWVATFCMDAKIGAATGGRRGLDDLLRLLLERYGLTGRRFTNRDLYAAASEVAGRDLGPELSGYVDSSSPIPIRACWADAGLAGENLNYSGETFVAPSPTASAGAKRVLDGILGYPEPF